MSAYLTPERIAYFWSQVDKSGDCWLWTAGVIEGGYGRLSRHRVLAHRFSWEIHYGPIPAGLAVLHACDNPPCVRPNHLMVGSWRANTIDAARKGRLGKPGRTHCPAGHRIMDDPYFVPRSRLTQCRRCRNERSAAASKARTERERLARAATATRR